jgi:hydroxymethylpyrimidine/phosphomethylpyrimidine kinase
LPSKTPLPPLCALTIATSDSGAGAGIQADLKTFAALGIYGLSAVAGVTAQNTRKVIAAEYLPPDLLRDQLKALFTDFTISIIKIGLLGTAANADVVLEFLSSKKYREIPVVLDPVICSTSGHVFLEDKAIKALIRLAQHSYLITPNIYEAEVLSGETITDFRDFHPVAERIQELDIPNVLVKGGHLTDRAVDLLLMEDGHFVPFAAERLRTKNDHGTGCTLSSAIAANLAMGQQLTHAIKLAKTYVTKAMDYGPKVGKGHGPLHHFYQMYKYED